MRLLLLAPMMLGLTSHYLPRMEGAEAALRLPRQ